ncbi:hypothetical protein [Rhizobium sp. ZPR3]|uniref:Uncharacterized protein n=2 Tax=unclassified Rhizobium TaxID=2613769 RepID=A0AAU7SMS5_9HYPH
MSLELYAALAAVTVALVPLLGPNAALITANSIPYPIYLGLLTWPSPAPDLTKIKAES